MIILIVDGCVLIYLQILFFITLFVSIGRVAAGFELVGVITPRSSHEINGSIWSVGMKLIEQRNEN